MEIYDRPGVCSRLKVQLLKVEVVETLIYGCMRWSPKKPDYDRLRRGASPTRLKSGVGHQLMHFFQNRHIYPPKDVLFASID